MTSGLVRLYTAYNISNPVLYQLCIWTFVIALSSFVSEIVVYKTAPLTSPGVYPAVLMSCTSLHPLERLPLNASHPSLSRSPDASLDGLILRVARRSIVSVLNELLKSK